MTRIISGRAGGLRLATPAGAGTRPTSDRVREALFSRLEHLDVLAGAHVLDLYAGSGAVGIEALSRGAEHATFVERGRQPLAAIRHNLARTGLEARATVRAGDVMRYVAEAGTEAPFDLVFMDPPYAERAILAPLERIVPLLSPEADVVVKHFWRTEVPVPAGLARWRERRFGETALTFMTREEEP